MIRLVIVIALSLCGLAATAQEQAQNLAAPTVELKTDLGTMVVELYPAKAPQTVSNFLALVENGFYDGLIFHRVIPGFMAQTGGFTFDFQRKEPPNTVVNESSNGLNNTRGTLAMARTMDPDSASSQFLINLVDNPHLDATADKPGYTVFGKVIEGLDTVDQIAKEPRGQYRQFPDAPNVPVRILKARLRQAETPAVKETTESAAQ